MLHIHRLPFPPSLNRAYRAVAGRVLLSEAGRRYVLQVVNALPKGRIEPLKGRLIVQVWLHPPAKLAGKRWDVMNREKLLCDALTKARVWLDDSQIDAIQFMREDAQPGHPDGLAHVHITELDP